MLDSDSDSKLPQRIIDFVHQVKTDNKYIESVGKEEIQSRLDLLREHIEMENNLNFLFCYFLENYDANAENIIQVMNIINEEVCSEMREKEFALLYCMLDNSVDGTIDILIDNGFIDFLDQQWPSFYTPFFYRFFYKNSTVILHLVNDGILKLFSSCIGLDDYDLYESILSIFYLLFQYDGFANKLAKSNDGYLDQWVNGILAYEDPKFLNPGLTFLGEVILMSCYAGEIILQNPVLKNILEKQELIPGAIRLLNDTADAGFLLSEFYPISFEVIRNTFEFGGDKEIKCAAEILLVLCNEPSNASVVSTFIDLLFTNLDRSFLTKIACMKVIATISVMSSPDIKLQLLERNFINCACESISDDEVANTIIICSILDLLSCKDIPSDRIIDEISDSDLIEILSHLSQKGKIDAEYAECVISFMENNGN